MTYYTYRGVFSTDAMGALAPAIFGHFSTVGKNKNLINAQHPQLQIPRYAPAYLSSNARY